MATFPTPEQLQTRFNIPGLTFWRGQGGLTALDISAAHGAARIYLHGAHVVSYTPKGGRAVLFLSNKSHFEAGKPIRGGVPVIFPWFGPKVGEPAAPMHGFARLSEWNVESAAANAEGSITVVFTLGSDDSTRKLWPYDFQLRYTVTVGAALELSLEVHNTSRSAFTFEEALHSYFIVKDAREVAVSGLEGSSYLDKTDPTKPRPQGDEPIQITAETDRVYLNTQSTCIIDDPGAGRRISIKKRNSDVTVVWNPWIAKSKAMPDFGDDEWPDMLCVETVNAAQYAVKLDAGATHVMSAAISTAS